MNKRIVYDDGTGRVYVVRPVINSDETLTEGEAVARALARIPGNATNVSVIDAAALPRSRTRRAAWRLVAGSIQEDANAWSQHQDAMAVMAIDGLDRLQFEHLYDLENRTRVLELKIPISRAQYRQALIDKWKTLNP